MVGWCQAITLFAKAARAAGPDLNRRTFVTAMSKITNFPGTSTPVLSFGPDKRYGPTEYKIVKLRNNVPALLPLPADLPGQGPRNLLGHPRPPSHRFPPADRTMPTSDGRASRCRSHEGTFPDAEGSGPGTGEEPR